MTISFLLQIGGLTGPKWLQQMRVWILHFLAIRSHSMVKLTFYLFGDNLIFLKKTWSHHLFLFYFFKRKQNKKENPKLWLKIIINLLLKSTKYLDLIWILFCFLF